MGGIESKNIDFKHASELFNESEHSQMQDLYRTICKGGKWLSKHDLQNYCCKILTADICDALHHYMKLWESEELQLNQSASYESFVVCMAHALKGSADQKTYLLTCLSTGHCDVKPTLQHLTKCLGGFWKGFYHVLRNDKNYSTWRWTSSSVEEQSETVIKTLLGDIASAGTSEEQMTKEVLESWLEKNAPLLRVIDVVFHACFPINYAQDSGILHQTPFPRCLNSCWDRMSTLLDPQSIFYLNFHIPHELRHQWRLLFSSQAHGESFVTLYRRASQQGPTLLVLKDTHGHVFGAFATDSWAYCSKFYGSEACFLFRLQPQLELYPATGYNSNYMYISHGQETLPNGLGMGGQLGYFGLFLSEEFTRGHSRAEPRCTTYGSPQLSADPDFHLQALEVWGLGPEPWRPDEDDEENANGSILDKDPEAKAMLALIDKGPHSEGLRERDPMADTPEEHTLPAGLG